MMKKRQNTYAFQAADNPLQASNDHFTPNNAPVATNNDPLQATMGHCTRVMIKWGFSKTIL